MRIVIHKYIVNKSCLLYALLFRNLGILGLKYMKLIVFY